MGVNKRTYGEDLTSGTAIQMATQLSPGQNVGFVVTVGDQTTGWKETRDCYEAALSSKGTVRYFKQFDDRADFGTGEPNGPEYQAKTTNNFDAHVAAMLYYTDSYATQLVNFFNTTLSPKHNGP